MEHGRVDVSAVSLRPVERQRVGEQRLVQIVGSAHLERRRRRAGRHHRERAGVAQRVEHERAHVSGTCRSTALEPRPRRRRTPPPRRHRAPGTRRLRTAGTTGGTPAWRRTSRSRPGSRGPRATGPPADATGGMTVPPTTANAATRANVNEGRPAMRIVRLPILGAWHQEDPDPPARTEADHQGRHPGTLPRPVGPRLGDRTLDRGSDHRPGRLPRPVPLTRCLRRTAGRRASSPESRPTSTFPPI